MKLNLEGKCEFEYKLTPNIIVCKCEEYCQYKKLYSGLRFRTCRRERIQELETHHLNELYKI